MRLDPIGHVARGFEADLVAVPGNPVENIREMEKVSFVMRAGRVIQPQ